MKSVLRPVSAPVFGHKREGEPADERSGADHLQYLSNAWVRDERQDSDQQPKDSRQDRRDQPSACGSPGSETRNAAVFRHRRRLALARSIDSRLVCEASSNRRSSQPGAGR